MEKSLKKRLTFLACASLAFTLSACGDSSGSVSEKTCGSETCTDKQECREDKCVDLCGDEVCKDNQVCEDNICVDKADDPCSKCTENQVCENNICVDKADDPCSKCTENQVCENNTCVDKDDPCSKCTENQVCENNTCVDKADDPCSKCTENQICENNTCVDKDDPCSKCTDEQRCINNICKDLCGENVCTDSQKCVDSVCKDLCGEDVCSDTQSCVEDACVDNDPCTNKICDDGYRCNAGECVEIDPCEGIVCGEAQTCVKARCIDDACLVDGTEKTCDEGKVCSKGDCVDDGCEKVTCNDGWQCMKGVCEETACLDVICNEGRSCKGGTCVDNECLDVTCEGEMVCSKGLCTYTACLDKDPCVTGKTCDAEGICQFDVKPAISIDAPDDFETDENGDTALLTLHLNNAPTQEVYVTCKVETESPNKEVEVSCGEIVFNSENWQNPQSVIITGVNDYLIDGDQRYKVVITTNSGDNDFHGLEATSSELTNLDRTVAGFVFSDVTLTTYEDQSQEPAKFTLALSSIPSDTVSLALNSSNTNEGKLDKNNVSFDATNWNIPQEISVKGVDDEEADGNKKYTIFFSPSESDDLNYNEMQPDAIKVTNVDNDVAGFVVNNPDVLEIKENQDVVLHVKLNTKPKKDVKISVAIDDKTEAKSDPEFIVLNDKTWSTGADIKITGLADNTIDGDQPIKITFTASSEDNTYNILAPIIVDATVVDMDVADIVNSMSEAAIVKEGNGDTVTMSLSLASIPTDDVSIAISVSDSSELKFIGKSKMTFKKDQWNSPQEIYVNSVDDHLVDGNVKSKVVMKMTSGDKNFDGITKEVEFTTVDDDVAAFDISSNATSFPENGGATSSMTVALKAQPTTDVKVTVASSDTTELEVTSSKTLTFTKDNWNKGQVVNIKVVDDNLADGTQTAVVKFTAASDDTNFNDIKDQSATYTIIDNEAPSVVLTASPLTIAQASPKATASVVLGVEPTSDVTVNLAASNDKVLSFSKSSLTFTSKNWNTPQDITVNVNFANVASASSTEFIQATASGGVYAGIKSAKISFNLVKVAEVQNFAYTGNVQTKTLPAGKYKLEAWGAQGGGTGGKGGYSVGTINLTKPTMLYIYVGGQGSFSTSTGAGFNGGGLPTESSYAGGGGASDIRIATDSLYSRVIVAGGGGGYRNGFTPGGGGGLTSVLGSPSSDYCAATVATISSPGISIANGGKSSYSQYVTDGAFGVGGSWSSYGTLNGFAGGGGGWYGGGCGHAPTGGSGWVYTAANYSTWKSGNATDANKYTLTSIYYLDKSQTIAANASVPGVSGGSETGHSGNGHVRITLVP